MLCVKIIRGHKKDGLFCSFGTSGKRSLHSSLEASKFENIRFAFQSDRKHVENGTFEKNKKIMDMHFAVYPFLTKKIDMFSNISCLAWTKNI